MGKRRLSAVGNRPSAGSHKQKHEVRGLKLTRVLALIAGMLLLAQLANAQVAVTTYRYDNGRTGQNVNEAVLTPSNVNVNSFGKLFSYSLPSDSYVYAQPLYLPNVNIPGVGLRNVLYVATEHDIVYAFDADGLTSTPYWQVDLAARVGGTQITTSSATHDDYLGPNLGVSSTPVIDQSTGTMYVVSNTLENGNRVQRLQALDVTTGAPKFGGSVVIQGPASGPTFDPSIQNQRPALLLANGNVYIGWGAYGDNGPYHGWIMAYSASTLAQVSVYCTTPNGTMGSNWMLGSLTADASGNIYTVTGNGSVDGNGDHGESVIKVSPTLAPINGFTPSNWSTLNNNDLDLGGGGLLQLPDQAGTTTTPHLAVLAGKEGTLYLLNRDDLGQFAGANGGSDHVVQEFLGEFSKTPCNVDGECNFQTPAYWNNNVYFIAANHPLQVYQVANGTLSKSSTQGPTTFVAPRGASPVVSANGTSNGIVWALRVDDASSNAPDAILYAYDASNVANELYNSNQNAGRDSPGVAQFFIVPVVANGKVYVATRDQVSTYGLFNNPPFGYLETINGKTGTVSVPQNSTIQITGWATDKEDGAPVSSVQVLLDGTAVGNATLGGSRPDVASAFGDSRYTNSGWTFSYNIGTLSLGSHTFTAVATDSGGATTTLTGYNGSGPITVTSANSPPFGYLETINGKTGAQNIAQGSTIQVSGWAADKQDGSPVAKVQVLIDGTAVGNATLGGARPDVASAFGDSRYASSGWTFSYNIGNLAVGSHNVTAVATDSAGATATLSSYNGTGPITVVSSNTPPFGYLELINGHTGTQSMAQGSTMQVSGWAADKEDGSPVKSVQILIDGAAVGNATLGGSRPDVASAFGDSRYSSSGWSFSYNTSSLSAGSHTVTAVATDSAGASTTLSSYQGTGPITITSSGSVQSIAHVFFMLQENHSFDNYFGRMGQYRANKGFTDSFDGVPLSASYTDANGNAVSPYHLATVCTEDLAPGWDPMHLAVDGGAMDRFPLETQNYLPSSIDSGGRRSMGYYDWTDLPYYYELAFQFGTSDRHFSSVLTRTIPNRMYMFAATSFGHINNDSPPGGGWTQATIFDRLDAAGIKWRIYRVDETNSLADWSVYARDSGKVFPISQYFTDLQSESTTPQVVFIDRGGGSSGLDEHPGSDIQSGAAEVAKIINALLGSPSWHSSAFFLSWDEPGGFYDHVAPVSLTAPDNIAPMLCCGEPSGDFAHSGLRVPVVVVSPWVKPHFVSHVVRDHTSILKFIETRFNLQPLTARDANADNMLEFFDFSTPHLATPPSLPSQPTNGNCDAGSETANS